MKSVCFSIPPFLRVCAASSLFIGSAFSQSESLESLVEGARVAMEAKSWQQALDFNIRAISIYGKGAPLRAFGAQFGSIYYRKGLCEMKLKKWEDAMASFEICYRDFPNRTAADNGNLFQKMALLKWGESAMGSEKWEIALSRFSKFTDERDREKDVFPQGSFYINTSICHYKLGHVAAGNENLEIAIRNKENFPTPEVGIVAAFQELVSGAIAGRNEQALLDFIGKNRGELVIGSAEMQRFNAVFLKLAGDALAVGMQRAAIAVYQFVPPDDTGASSPDIVKLGAIALIHEKNGNLRGAFAAYRQLEDYYPAAANRGENLYQLVRVASLIGEAEAARRYARALFTDFPNSPHLAELRAAGIDFEEGELPPSPPHPGRPASEPQSRPFSHTRGFSAAVDLFEGRKYVEARSAFAGIKSRSKSGNPPQHEIAALAGFYESECCRKLGDLEGMAEVVKSMEKVSSLGNQGLEQLEIDGLWDEVRAKNWPKVDQMATERMKENLPGDLRAQVAYCHGLALRSLGRQTEALNSHNIVITADSGSSEDVARQAALQVMAILKGDAEVEAAMNESDPEKRKTFPGNLKLQEAAAMASLFELSLGAGQPLLGDFRNFLRFKAVP